MATILTTTQVYTSGQQVTHTNLNNLISTARFVAGTSGSTDGVTLDVNGDYQIYVKDGNISAAKLASNSVTTAKITDANVTPAKLSAGAPSWDSATTTIAASLDFAAISSTATAGTYGRSGNTVTITMAGHGMSTGMVAALTFTGGTGGSATNGSYPITYVSSSQFTIIDSASGTITGSPACSRTAYYGNSTIRGSETIAGNLSVTKDVAISKDLSVTGSLTLAGTALNPATLGTAQNSTSGTTVSFNDIPSWVKRVTVIFGGVSVSGANEVEIVLGTGSSGTPVYVTSGYSGGGNRLTSSGTGGIVWTTGFMVRTNTGATVTSGHMVITKLTGNTWVASSVLGGTSGDFSFISGGNIALGSALTQLRIKTTSTDTFDAGQINILYE
jgi:hypothetical protein